MIIGIDARFYGTEHTGLGRYTTNVMAYLPQHLQGQALKVLLRKKYYETLKLPKNCEKVLADFPHYSLAEQWQMPSRLRTVNCQLLYSFHFNVPLRLDIPFVVTIHDLIKSHFRGSDTTTRAPWLFRLKRLGYDYTIRHAIHHSRAIIVPTNTVKNDILALFNADPTKIRAIPEAPDSVFRSSSAIGHRPSNIPPNYLLFVGNAYPHKNLSVLLDALKLLPDVHLVIVSQHTPFLEQSLAGVDSSRIHILSDLSDQELVQVYAQARALVTPSLMEGYGLPGIEALMVGTPVIASNIPVYREVYGDKVTYFDPHSMADLRNKIEHVTRLPRYPITPLPSFTRSWDHVAADIAEVIHESCASL